MDACRLFFSVNGLFYVVFFLLSSLARRTKYNHATLIFPKLKPFSKHIISWKKIASWVGTPILRFLVGLALQRVVVSCDKHNWNASAHKQFTSNYPVTFWPSQELQVEM